MDNVLNTVQRLKQIETTQKMYSTRAKQVLRNKPRFHLDIDNIEKDSKRLAKEPENVKIARERFTGVKKTEDVKTRDRFSELPAHLQENIELRKDILEMMDKVDKFELNLARLDREHIDAISDRQRAYADGETDLTVHDKRVDDALKRINKELPKIDKMKAVMQPYLDEFKQMN